MLRADGPRCSVQRRVERLREPNAVGLEQVQLWSRLGADVTVVEAQPRLAPYEEPELGDVIENVFYAEGIASYTGATTVRVERDPYGYRLTLANGTTTHLVAEQLLVATGRPPVTADLDLDAVGIRIGPRGEVVVNEHLRTHNPRIWAAEATSAPNTPTRGCCPGRPDTTATTASTPNGYDNPDGGLLFGLPREDGRLPVKERVVGATAGPLSGKQVARYPSLDTFWFAWVAFQPDTQIIR